MSAATTPVAPIRIIRRAFLAHSTFSLLRTENTALAPASAWKDASHIALTPTPDTSTTLTLSTLSGARSYTVASVAFLAAHFASRVPPDANIPDLPLPQTSEFAEYIRAALASGLPNVQFVDIKPLLDYLFAKVPEDNIPWADAAAAAGAPTTSLLSTAAAPSSLPQPASASASAASSLAAAVAAGAAAGLGGRPATSSIAQTAVKRPADGVPDAFDPKRPRPGGLGGVDDGDLGYARRVAARESTVGDRRTVLQAKGTTKTFDHVRRIAEQHWYADRKPTSASATPAANGVNGSAGRDTKRPLSTTAPTPTSSTSRRPDARNPTSTSSSRPPAPGAPSSRPLPSPIIIVPSLSTALVQMYNVKELLEGGSFKHPDDIRRENPAKEPRLHVRHKFASTGKEITFSVVDNGASVRPDEWDRVVACFVHEQPWQFSNWRWTEPREVFQHVKGFYLKWHDAEVKEPVKGWNVAALSVNRNRRHMDLQTVTEFWEKLERFMRERKPRYLA
ncbi:CDC73-domain-containing protein [Gonapodya prolifera JEL478]|uniref:CDC73-domain-containing protein n=1 Tax=Gonapodya prolifera (strain JEL478) TaxID=1344416 RepID=A0A139AS41_GONPJ|nr:CDC73-domain-containing protein [Gonapodya prolifera JEL478]|eukprot:KXS19568.1 CDC73-domain-containing protein [Gonapodya prolifera JEL478]